MAMLPAAVNSVGTLVGMWQIDKCGRRCSCHDISSLHPILSPADDNVVNDYMRLVFPQIFPACVHDKISPPVLVWRAMELHPQLPGQVKNLKM